MQQLYAKTGDAMDLLRPSCSGVENELPPPASCYVPTYSDYSDYSSDSEEECTSEEEEDLSISRRPAPALRKLPFQDEVQSFKDSLESCTGKVNQWVAAWKESDEDGRRAWTWIHVYAYYSKKKRHGGYGVILLDALGNPITAAASFSETGVSFYYQVFKGIDAGVTLAERHDLSDHLRVQCNSSTAPAFFRQLSACSDDQCRNANDLKGVCDRCKGCFSTRCCGTCEMVVPLVLKLRHKNYPRELSSTWDLAAHYVARIEKNKVLKEEVESKKKKRRREEAVKEESSATSDAGSLFILPDDFPRELLTILWVGSFAMKRMVMMKK